MQLECQLENPSPTPLRVRGNLDRARELQRIAAKVAGKSPASEQIMTVSKASAKID